MRNTRTSPTHKVSEGRLSDASKTQIQKMLRQISELESIGDSVYNLGRTLNRHRMHCQENFTDNQKQHMLTMMQLVDAALTEMLKRIDQPTTKNGVKTSLNIEHEINNYRTQLKPARCKCWTLRLSVGCVLYRFHLRVRETWGLCDECRTGR